jgi:hypothetical protein
MLNPFAWIRQKAAEAFVQGIADGAAALTPEGEQPPSTSEELRALFAASLPKALPAPKDDEDDDDKPAKGRKAK